MIKAIIIDDEKNAVELLDKLIKTYCSNIEVIAKCTSGEKGIESIKNLHPDVIFLDIEMPNKNGFDVIEETRHIPYQIIFTTAYNEFAVKAFKVAAIDYLLKPIDIVELQYSVKKLFNPMNQIFLDEKLQALISNYIQPEKSNKIALPIGDTIQFFSPNAIIRCESESNYTHVYLTQGKKITVAKTLKDVEDTLKGLGFLRVHNSHIVNLSHIEKIIKSDQGYIVMTDGASVPISRSRREHFMESFRKI